MKWLSFVIAFLCVSFGHALTVPQNVRAAAIGPNGFTIRWDVVTDAESYDVEVEEVIYFADFEDPSSIEGWMMDNAKRSHSPTSTVGYDYSYGALQLISEKSYATTPLFGNPRSLSFWIKRTGSLSVNMSVFIEYSNDGNTWYQIDEFDVVDGIGTPTIVYNQFCYNVDLVGDARFRFRYLTDKSCYVYIDDLVVIGSGFYTAMTDLAYEATRVSVSPNTRYRYRVRAINSTETGDYSAWQLVTTLDSSSDTVTGSIINNAPAQMDLPSVGSYSGQTMQITPSTGGDADYSVSVAAVDNGLSYSVSCESNAYLNGTYTISHPGYTASGIDVPMGELSFFAQNDGSTSFGIDSFESNGSFVFSLVFQDETLPVEMGSMSFSPLGAHADNLEWLSHSETNLLGYYVWRSETGSLQDARMISPLIQATNSSNGNAYVFQDTNDAPSASYWVEAVEYDGASTYHGPVIYQAPEQGSSAPNILVNELQNIYPNPFNPSATISYSLRDAQSVVIKVYDAKGRLVHSHDEPTKGPGRHQYIWNAEGAASGVYYVRMRIGEKSFERKIVLLK